MIELQQDVVCDSKESCLCAVPQMENINIPPFLTLRLSPPSLFLASPGSPLIFPDGLFTLHSFCLDSRKSSLYGTLGHDCVPLGCRSTHWKLIGTLGSLGSSKLALPNWPQSQKNELWFSWPWFHCLLLCCSSHLFLFLFSVMTELDFWKWDTLIWLCWYLVWRKVFLSVVCGVVLQT